MKNKTYLIYGLTDKLTGQLKYIGQTTIGLKLRLKRHFDEAKYHRDRITKKNNWLRKRISQNNLPEIFLIEETTEQEIDNLEIFYIAYFKSIGCELLNSTLGGKGHVGTPSKEKRQKYSNGQKKKKCIDLVTGEIYPSMMSIVYKYGFRTGAVSECCSGKSNMIKGNYFSYLPSDFSKEWVSKELAKRKSDAAKANTNKEHQFRPIFCLTNKKQYPSIKHASDDLNLSRSGIGAVASKRRGSLFGYKFEYLDGFEK